MEDLAKRVAFLERLAAAQVDAMESMKWLIIDQQRMIETLSYAIESAGLEPGAPSDAPPISVQ